MPAMEMFTPEPDFEDSLLGPDYTTDDDNDHVAIQATMSEPIVTCMSFAKSKEASLKTLKKRKITLQNVQSMAIRVNNGEMLNWVGSWEFGVVKKEATTSDTGTKNQKPVTIC